jgi:hypothetical protein
MSTAQIRYLPSNQSQRIVKMLGAWHQATDPHFIVSVFTAVGLIPFMGGDGLVYMRLDRQRATRIRTWAGQNPHPINVGESGNRKIRLPTQHKAESRQKAPQHGKSSSTRHFATKIT